MPATQKTYRPHETGLSRLFLKLYFYRPGIDFVLDKRLCCITVPLVIDTVFEASCIVEADPSNWRFDPITWEWRRNSRWTGYHHDPRLFTKTENPADADYFVFPYMLEEMTEAAGPAWVSSWLRQLPHYAGNEHRHVFMTLHDSSVRFNLESVFFRASIQRSCRDDRAVAIPYAVEDLIRQTHFDPSRIRYDATFAGSAGCPVSGPVRRQVIASLAKTTRIKTFVSPAERFHGHQKGAERQERRELFLKSLAESWMVVCPRGAGVNTYQFFETLSMGRIPALISDDCLLPFEDRINYDAFMLRIPEKDAGHSAEIIAQWLATQTTETLLKRCRLARRTWEEYCACTRWNHRIVETLRRYLDADDEAVIVDGVIFQLQQRNPFGISRLWLALLSELGKSALAKRLLLLDRDGTAPRIPGIKTRAIPAFRIGSAKQEAVALDTVCREERAGLFISTYYTFTQETRSMLMLYDMIPERFQTVGADAPNPEWRDKHHAIENSSSFTAISQSTVRDLALFYPHAAARPQTVIPCAVSDAFRTHSTDEIAAFKAASGLSKRYFLLVGRRDAHKNVRLFFQAFARLPDRERYAIVMAGAGHEIEPELRELIAGADSYAGFFSDQDLALLYSGALALVYPSIYEGFGLPILEAMQSGCPVITCHNSSIFEVAGRAALYVEERDVDGLAKTLLDVQQPDVRDYLIKAGLEQAQRFSWKKSAVLLAATINAQSPFSTQVVRLKTGGQY
jgi:glycosyltransferase involved in cell wall biosynthesis